ncbi:MAG: CPBP family intramembrane glutamic endopeptidase [Dehalococcoidia bacterium]
MFADPPPLIAPPEAAPPRWTKGDVALGIAAIAGVLGLLVVVALVARPRGFVGGLLGTLAFEIALAVIPLALARRRGISLPALGFVMPKSWWSVLGIWIATYGVLVGYAVLLAALDGAGVDVTRFEGGNPVPLPRGASWPAVLGLGAVVVLVAPVAEELYFRAFLFRAARPRLGLLLAALLSGVLFSLFHANLAVVLPFALVGALFAWGFEASGSLWTSIAAHFLVNGAGFAATLAQLGGGR